MVDFPIIFCIHQHCAEMGRPEMEYEEKEDNVESTVHALSGLDGESSDSNGDSSEDDEVHLSEDNKRLLDYGGSRQAKEWNSWSFALIGLVLKKFFEDGVVKREDLWITSKLWNSSHEPEDVALALDRTLRDLQIDYLDLYLIHWPVKMKKGSAGFEPENLDQPDIPSTWKAMETLYDSGKARVIGVSNFSTKKLGDLLEVARVPPAVNQVELHPSWQQQKLREFCKSKGVHLSGYSPLGSPGTTWMKSEVLKHPVVNMVAEKLGKTPAQVCLRWGLQLGNSVLPKSTNEVRIKENFDVFDWCIPEDLLAMFLEMEQARLLRGTSFVHETYGAYKSVEDLWDGEI